MTYWEQLLDVFYNTKWPDRVSVAERWRIAYEYLQARGVH